jgi:DNA-binding Xre family transcriptional regulator
MSNSISTLDRMMQNPDFKKEFDDGYEEFLISEKICDAMNEMNISVRQLAEKARVSKTTIMNLRTGDAEKITVRKLNHILGILNYKLQIDKVSQI